ncbi:MAG: ABC transporter substrate-binding protein, partial [Methylococcales bacterium]|nr:ABC transporter substrate-binding protein [Methylococcales bacterium]
MRLKRLAILTLSLSSLYATSAFSQEESATARQIIDKFQTELIHVMKDGKKLGYAGRYEKLEPAVVNSHDLPKIARIVVGKEGEKLTEEQQKKLADVFTRISVASYAHNFKDFSGEEFIIDSEEETKNGGVVIHSHLTIPDDKPVKFDYMLKEKGASWRIINIIANGV